LVTTNDELDKAGLDELRQCHVDDRMMDNEFVVSWRIEGGILPSYFPLEHIRRAAGVRRTIVSW